MMKYLNIGIVIVAISLTLASCGNRTEQNSSETQNNQSDISKPAASSENHVVSERTSSDIPVSSAMAEKNVTSKNVVKTESDSLSSKPNTVSTISSKAHVSSQASASSSSTTNKITEADSEWIADRVLELINAERKKLGSPALSTAPKAHEIATIRAQQLTTFFSHEDELGNNAAAIVYHKYKYNPNATSEFAVYDKEGNYEWYRSYGPGGSENIGQVGNGSCTDINVDAANDLFYGFKSSSAHWSDISNPEYTGVGIGVVVIQKGMGYDAYCCILTMDRTYG